MPWENNKNRFMNEFEELSKLICENIYFCKNLLIAILIYINLFMIFLS